MRAENESSAARPRLDAQQFTDAYVRHATAMLNHIRGILPLADAEQVVHDTFLQYWLNPDRHDPRRGSLRTYLKVVARSRAIDQLRSGRATERRDRDWADETPAVHIDAAFDHERDDVRAALAALPADQRTPIVFAFFTGATYSQVAARLGIAEGTIKTRIRSGLGRLRDELVSRGGPDEAPGPVPTDGS